MSESIGVPNRLSRSIERFYADGRYECYIDGKLIEGSPYWHGKPPFVMMNWKEIPL